MRTLSLMRSAIAILVLAASTVHAESSDLNIYGFMSVGVGVLDNDNVTIEGFEGEGNFKQDTILALQVTKQVNDKTTATGQLVSRGTDDFKTEAAWAFVSYQATEDFTARMGRLRIPFFYYSEFLEVGYAYNWVRLPSDIYNIPFSSFDGVDFTQRFSIGSLDSSIQINYGRLTDELNIFDEDYKADLRNMAGISLNSTYGDWGFRLGGQRTEMTLDTQVDTAYLSAVQAAKAAVDSFTGDYTDSTGVALIAASAALAEAQVNFDKTRRIDQGQTGAILVSQDMGLSVDAAEEFALDGHTADFYNAAITYDNGSYSFIAEVTATEYESGLLVDNRAWLTSVAKRMGSTTTHLTYSTSRDVLNSGDSGKLQEALNLQGEDESVTLGLRYDYDVNTALKLEAQYHDELVHQGEKGDHAMLYSFAVDVIF
ncbi:MAG: hypothetical protein ACI9OH_003258 [Oleispira sp.]|jgi:hypothetical protein